jgi:hypothetical protein
MSSYIDDALVIAQNESKRRLAQGNGAFNNGVENRLNVTGRPADDEQDLAGRPLKC